MCHAYFLGEGVAILLLRAIDSLYRDRGVYQGKSATCPTMADVRQWLRDYKVKGRESGWMESATRAVETLSFGELGRVLNQGPFFDPAQLLEKRVILELDALTNTDKTFLIEAFLLWIHHYRLAQESRETFKHAIIIEEAHHILLRKKQEATGEETVTDVLLREIRELGESIICLDQHPSLISKPALGNTYTTFAMNLKHRGDIAMIQDSLLLDSEQAGYLGRLEVGWAIVRLQGRWFWPFLVKVPLLRVNKGAVTDARLQQIMGKRKEDLSCLLDRSTGVSGVIPTKDEKPGVETDQKQPIAPISCSDKRREEREPCTIGLTTKQKLLLEDIEQHPTSSVTERYARLGFSPRCGHVVQRGLVSKGFVNTFNIVIRRGRIKALALTKEGARALGLEMNDSNRRGGPEHRYWVQRIAEHLQDCGYEFEKEAPAGGGKTIDVVASRDGQKIAVEIETGHSDVRANLEKCLAYGADRVVVVTTSAKAEAVVRRQVDHRTGAEVVRAATALDRMW